MTDILLRLYKFVINRLEGFTVPNHPGGLPLSYRQRILSRIGLFKLLFDYMQLISLNKQKDLPNSHDFTIKFERDVEKCFEIRESI